MHDLLFSRRYTQDCLDRLGPVLRRDQLKDLVDDLNRPGRKRLSRLWEVAILDALSRLAPVRHEVPLPNGRKPDFAFDLPVEAGSVEVVGDITCVSDSGLDKDNPVAYFSQELARIARRKGVDPDRLAVRIAGKTEGKYRESRMSLNLPSKGALVAVLKLGLGRFFAAVSKAPDTQAATSIEQDDTVFTIAYNATQIASSINYPSYDVAYSLEHNPLAAGLKDKADQLREAPHDCIRLVVVCDGDCNTLKQTSSVGGHFTARAIVEHFLRRTSTVDAVLLLPIREAWSPGRSVVSLDCALYRRVTAGRRPALSDARHGALLDHLNTFLKLMPHPVLSAPNAAHQCNKTGFSYGLHGGYWQSGNILKVSSRQILEALAGLPSHGLPPPDAPADSPLPPPDWQEFFRDFLFGGKMISKVTVVPNDGTDDDTLEFEFTSPDAATSPFRLPKSS